MVNTKQIRIVTQKIKELKHNTKGGRQIPTEYTKRRRKQNHKNNKKTINKTAVGTYLINNLNIQID